jgi:pre-mRNA-processing factor 39
LLIEIVDCYVQDDLERMRAVYEPFLAAYPLCYGYWKKYADAENRHGNVEAALAVYERGVAATPYSMDLWVQFATYKKANGGTPEEVRG